MQIMHRFIPANKTSSPRAVSPASALPSGWDLPAFCSRMGAVARGTVFMSKGFSEGSSVYWCRAFSMPGTDTVSPAEEKGRKNSVLRAGADPQETQNRQSRKKAALKMRQSCQV